MSKHSSFQGIISISRYGEIRDSCLQLLKKSIMKNFTFNAKKSLVFPFPQNSTVRGIHKIHTVFQSSFLSIPSKYLSVQSIQLKDQKKM